MKNIVILLLLSTVAGCYVFSREKYTQENSALEAAKVNAISVEIINGGVFTITKKDSLQQLVSDLNNARYAGMWKGAHWDKVQIQYQDTVITLNTNGKVFGHGSSGRFYHLNDKYQRAWYGSK